MATSMEIPVATHNFLFHVTVIILLYLKNRVWELHVSNLLYNYRMIVSIHLIQSSWISLGLLFDCQLSHLFSNYIISETESTFFFRCRINQNMILRWIPWLSLSQTMNSKTSCHVPNWINVLSLSYQLMKETKVVAETLYMHAETYIVPVLKQILGMKVSIS